MDGWIPENKVLSYASATTFTVSGDLTAQYQKGTRLKFTQTTVKYFVVIGSSFSSGTTTITVTGGDDYSLANASIVEPFYSYQASPQGYPTWFNYTPTYSADGSMTFTGVTTHIAKFRIIGKECVVILAATGTLGGSNSYGVLVTYPITPDNNSNQYGGGAQIIDGLSVAGIYYVGSSSFNFARYDANTWSLGASREIHATITYGI